MEQIIIDLTHNDILLLSESRKLLSLRFSRPYEPTWQLHHRTRIDDVTEELVKGMVLVRQEEDCGEIGEK